MNSCFVIMKTIGILGGLGPETTAKIYLAVAMGAEDYPWHSYF